MGTNGYSQKKRPFSNLGNMWKHITDYIPANYHPGNTVLWFYPFGGYYIEINSTLGQSNVTGWETPDLNILNGGLQLAKSSN
jgi:hypothetical protein